MISKHRLSAWTWTIGAFSLGLFAACAPANQATMGGEAPRTAMGTKLMTCATTKLSTGSAIVGSEIAVCRKNSEQKLAITPILPSYYAGAKNKRVRVVQIAAVQVSYANGYNPESRIRLQSEVAVNEFLTKTCAPMMKGVMKRSGVRARFLFRPLQANERLMTKSDALMMDNFSLFEDSAKFKPVVDAKAPVAKSPADGDDKKSKDKKPAEPQVSGGDRDQQQDLEERRKERDPVRIAAALAAVPANLILDVVLGEDQGITIKDHPTARSSGPLKAEAAKEDHLAFCGQLMSYMGEYLGLGGLKEGESCKATAAASVSKKPNVGLMKSASETAVDYSKLRLDTSEISDFLAPACGDIKVPAVETAPPKAK